MSIAFILIILGAIFLATGLALIIIELKEKKNQHNKLFK